MGKHMIFVTKTLIIIEKRFLHSIQGEQHIIDKTRTSCYLFGSLTNEQNIYKKQL